MEQPRVQTFELCRFLAGAHRDAVLATPAERRVSTPPDVPEFLILDDWNHANVGIAGANGVAWETDACGGGFRG